MLIGLVLQKLTVDGVGWADNKQPPSTPLHFSLQLPRSCHKTKVAGEEQL